MEIKVVHCQKSGYEVYGGRGAGDSHMLNTEPDEKGWLGNPFEMGKHGDREKVIEKFREAIQEKVQNDEKFREELEKLPEKSENGVLRLACWCTPKPCHLDVVAEGLRRKINQNS